MCAVSEGRRLYGTRLPSDLLPAQQVCLHVSRFAGPAARGEPSARLRDWLSLVLGAPRYDVYYKGGPGNKFGPGSARLRVKDYNFDAWLSEPLIQVGFLPSGASFYWDTVNGGHTRGRSAGGSEPLLFFVLRGLIHADEDPPQGNIRGGGHLPRQRRLPDREALD